jgi:hypothetical protein
MIQVFHAIKPTFGLKLVNLPEPKFPADFELVAEVDTDSIGEAFRLTNHIDHSWYENEGVKTIKKARSTSVGDIVVTSTGAYQCMPLGWEKYNDEQKS